MWLNNWPAGLKLNTELSQFFCYIFIAIVCAWARTLRLDPSVSRTNGSAGILIAIAPYYPVLFWVAGVTGCFGMTIVISLLADVLRFLTAHLSLCYYLSAIVFRLQLGLIRSLWNLFRGMSDFYRSLFLDSNLWQENGTTSYGSAWTHGIMI